MKKQRVMATVLSLAMAASLAACGSNAGSTTAASTGTAQTGSEASNEVVTDADQTNANADLEHVTLHFIFFGDKKSATDEVWQKIADYLAPTLNCDFDIQFVAGDDYANKLTVKAAAGDVWDMNFDSNWTGYFQMANNNAYMALEDLLPEYAPDLYKKYQDSGYISAMTNKGHITVLPWTMKMNNRPFFQWRGDLAEAAGIDVNPEDINTIEDVDKLLYKLHDAYPDRYTIECCPISPINGGYAELDWNAGLYYKLDDPKCTVIRAEDMPEFKTYWDYGKKWQDDGLIWKDVLTDKADHNSLINQGKLITKWGTHEFATQNRAWVEEGARWDYHEIYKDDLFANRTPLANAVCISATSENPERTLMFLNQLETDQALYDMVHYGIEGKTYVLGPNGEADYPDGMDSASSNYMEWGGRWALWKSQFMRPDASYGKGFWEEEEKYADSSDKNVSAPLDGFSFDSTNVATQYAQRNQIFGDAKKLLDVGMVDDVDAAIAQIKSDCDAAGTQDLVDEMQKQIEAYLASKN
jgi:putative aldouronate transport system substrate-binding protein